MKKYLLGAALFILVFTGSALIFNFIGNREFDTKSVEVVESTLEKAYISYDGQKINRMEVYSTRLLTGVRRKEVVPVDNSKTLNVIIPDSISDKRLCRYELRDMSGTNLIEEGDMSLVRDGEGENEYSVSLRMDMTQEKDYSIVFILSDDTGKADVKDYFYYSRVRRTEGKRFPEMIEYAEAFSNTLLSENHNTLPDEVSDDGGYYGQESQATVLPASETDAVLDIAKVGEYFEGKRDDYETYGHTEIDSEYEKAVMSGIGMSRVGDVEASITEVSGDYAVIKLSCRMMSREKEVVKYYTVNEYYALEFDPGRNEILMRDYERTIDEAFSKENIISGSNRIKIGLSGDEDPEYVQSEDFRKVAFVMDNTLWYYNSDMNYYTRVYGQSSLENIKDTDYGIRILSVDEREVDFVIYGRIPLGSYMSYNGIALYAYIISSNSIKEIDFIETDMTYDVLKQQVGRYAYYDRDNRYFYSLFSDKLLKINVLTNEKEEVISELPFYDMYVSQNREVLAYPNTKELQNVDTITLMSLKDDSRHEETYEGDKLSITGFVGDDLVYGIATPGDVTMGSDGVPGFLFSELKIVNKDGEIKKDYKKNNVLISDINYEEDNLYLTRVKKDKDGNLKEVSADYITSDPDQVLRGVVPKIHTNDSGIAGVYLDFPTNIYIPRGPEEVIARLARGDKPKKTFVSGDISDEVYYIFSNSGLREMSISAGRAIGDVTENKGFVADSGGDVIYREKQMKAFFTVAGTFDYTEGNENASKTETFYMCEYMLLRQAGLNVDYSDVSGRNDWIKICSDLSGGTVKGLNLSGAGVEAAIGYLSDGMAFIAGIQDRYVVVVSYNSDFVRYYDPIEGEEVRTGRWNFAENVRKNGNEIFIWYK